MADKGFDLKVLIPTEDGLTISESALNVVPYYLMYNISNRSYQFAGKIKVLDIALDEDFHKKLKQLTLTEKVDMIISNDQIKGTEIKIKSPESNDIGEELNLIIDLIDQKKELI